MNGKTTTKILKFVFSFFFFFLAYRFMYPGEILFYCCCSVAKSCLTLCNPMDCSTPGLPVHHHLPEFAKFMSIELVMPSNHLTLCRPLLLLPSIFPTIRIFSNELAVHIRWPKYWSFSFVSELLQSFRPSLG